MNEKVIRAIETVLERGERVELMKGPDGEIKILRIRRERVSTDKKTAPGISGTA